jgi:hypothetical protein
MKYETLEDVYSFLGLAILEEKSLRRTDIGKKENTLVREGDRTQYFFWRRQEESYLSFVVTG